MGLQETSILVENIRYRHYYLCHYIPLTTGIDTVSRSLLKFKRGAQPDLGNWLDRSLCAIQAKPIPLPSGAIIIRALHHRETRVTPDHPCSLDLLGQTLAGHFRVPYLPGLLHKTRPTVINQGLTRTQRQAELQDVYAINPAAFIQPPPRLRSILLLDDILTSGTTVRAIIRTIRPAADSISIFTLAKVA